MSDHPSLPLRLPPAGWLTRSPRPTTWAATLVLALLTLLMAVGVGCSASDGSTGTSAPTPAATEAGYAPASATSAPGQASIDATNAEAYLVVADPAEEALYVVAMPAGEIVATFDHVELTAHAGAVPLPDGRLLFADAHDDVLRILDLAAEGGPALVGRAPLSPGQAWSAVDPSFRYYAGASRTDTEAVVDLVDLDTLEVSQLRLPVTEDGETHIALGGDPLSAFVWTGGALHAFAVADIVAGTAAEPSSSVETGPGAHSQVFDQAAGVIYTSLPEALRGVRISGNALTESFDLPWDADGLAGGRVGRLRLSADGRYTYGALAATVPPEGWATRENHVHIADLQDGTVRRLPLASGIVGRGGLSERFALFYSIHPGGDEAILLDVDAGSPTFQQVTARIPLTSLTNGPRPGETSAGTNARGGTITPDGRWAFVSAGGDGLVEVIDTEAARVTGSITFPTALAGGGYLVAWQPGATLNDLIAR